MFAKLKENKLFKSLSENLCSIELVEIENKIPTFSYYPRIPSTSTPLQKAADKVTHPAP